MGRNANDDDSKLNIVPVSIFSLQLLVNGNRVGDEPALARAQVVWIRPPTKERLIRRVDHKAPTTGATAAAATAVPLTR